MRQKITLCSHNIQQRLIKLFSCIYSVVFLSVLTGGSGAVHLQLWQNV